MTLIFTNPTHPILPVGSTLALRNFYLGLGYLLFPLAMFFGASLLSDLSDRIGRKRVLMIAIFGLFLSFMSMGIGTQINSLFLLFLGRAASGVFAGSQPTAQAAIADMSSEDEKKRNFSIMTFVLSIGIILGPVIGGFFADPKISAMFNFSTPFYFTAGLAFLNAIWLTWRFEETHYPQEKKKIDLFRPIKIFLEAFENKRVLWMGGTFFLMQVGFATFYQLIQVRMAVQFGYQAWQLGMFNAAIGVSFALAIWISLKFFIKMFKEGVIGTITLFLTGVFLIFVGIVQTHVSVLIFSLLAAGFDMIAFSMMMTAFSRSVDSNRQGWIMGIFGATLAIAKILPGLELNLLTFTRASTVILLGGVSMMLSSLSMFLYSKKYR